MRRLIKQNIPERRLDKILRVRQFIKDSNFLDKHYRILPPVSHRIGNEVIGLSPISNLTPQAWRNLLQIYQKSTPEEQLDFREHVKTQIINDVESLHVLATGYIKHIFKNHESLYRDFLATALYVAGDLEGAYKHFAELNKNEPSAMNYLFMARCLMHIRSAEEEIALLNEGLNRFPQADLLHLSLANTYYRAGNTTEANNCLQRVSKDGLEKLQKKAHNLDILEKEIAEALEKKTIVRPVENLGFQAYTEESVQNYWETLFFHFVNQSRFQHGWGDLRYITEKKIESFINKHTDIKTVINFGVFCAVPDFNLANRHPEIKFIGVDRENSTKQLNDNAFQADNLSFHAMDLIDIIYSDRKEVRDFLAKLVKENPEVMIFHARTATLIYPEALKRFYKACAEIGIKYISLYENMCISRSHLKYFDFDDLPADSIPYFSIMMIHNYKKFLAEAGYDIVDKEIWNYSDLLWKGKDVYDVESYYALGDGHVALLAKLKSE